MSPARSAILWNMLVSGVADIVSSVNLKIIKKSLTHISPIPILWKSVSVNIFIGLRTLQELIFFSWIDSSASAFGSSIIFMILVKYLNNLDHQASILILFVVAGLVAFLSSLVQVSLGTA